MSVIHLVYWHCYTAQIWVGNEMNGMSFSDGRFCGMRIAHTAKTTTNKMKTTEVDWVRRFIYLFISNTNTEKMGGW